MAENTHGRNVWFFPDGELPDPGDRDPKGHESLIMLNPNGSDANVSITVYFPDAEPVRLDPVLVQAERVRCVRMDEPIHGYQVPNGQYALKLESDTPIVAQIGRMDVQQPNLAYYTTMGFAG